jgi:hypothetical protein
MHVKRIVCFLTLFILMNQMSAQIKYSYEDLKKTYETETIVLTQGFYEKNGMATPFKILSPSKLLKQDIEKNGGVEAKIQYKHYQETVGRYWLTYILGLLGIVFLAIILFKTMTAVAIIAYFVGAFSLLVYLGRLAKKLMRHLSYAIWYYNKNVLLKTRAE